ncbi:sensor histidine kinase [Lichenifustis flavocetrariae]|uniref:histidine kinase n=1 Tax=Lichenifustis flavocetrariae TaxID=2949735 RepID=A0AA41Z3L5_9HYPH|nr:histidine kinase dimerization/phosphoacceptor domain -containing protein [Lichenifustis flavocetrariae]MCW6512427.1 ATP-binding protein [Lichenifustis flavocetrariae]
MVEPPPFDAALDLALAVIASSPTPLIVLDGELTVIKASRSFCRDFRLDPTSVDGQPIFALGAGEWAEPRLQSLLKATASANAAVDAYEMELKSPQLGTRHLIINVQKLVYADKQNVRLLVAIADVTDIRRSEKLKDDLLREKAVLIMEIQHRIANSLQIIASLIMQSARNVQSDEIRGYLHTAHDRVISIAALQKHLAVSDDDTVEMGTYLTQLCQSLSASIIGNHDQLSIRVTADHSVLDGGNSVCIGLIVTELVINAVKHAFPAGRTGTIKIDFRSHGTDWTLSIRDDGIGMPLNRGAPGLGTSIVEALARQLDARIGVADRHPGTDVSLVHTQMVASNGNILHLRQPV